MTTRRLRDTAAYPYRSPYQDGPRPSPGELRKLQAAMQEAKVHLREWAVSALEGTASR